MPDNNNSPFMRWLAPLATLTDNPLSLAGVVLVTTGAISWFFLLPFLWQQHLDNPYFGILWILDLSVFVLGLILIPLGAFIRRAKLRRTAEPITVDLQSRAVRHLLLFIGIATVANIAIAGSLTKSAVNYMESKSFCGAACHVMAPEYSAYQSAPHSRVDCVECHSYPGAAGFIASKIAGTRQMLLVATNKYDRPIPTPVHNLPPASESCAGCHSLNGQPEDLVRVITKFGDDDKNTPSYTVLLLYLNKIHSAHLGNHTIRYASDAKRETISKVELTAGSKTTTFLAGPAGDKGDPPGDMRTMDCLDCHNRPAHTFEMPDRAVDHALSAGSLPSLPMIKKHAVEALKKGYASQEEAATHIASALAGLYSSQPKPDVDKATAAIINIYKANVFPEMKIDWGTYPNHVGHTDATGCFRCHDDAHTSPEKVSIGQDCSLCHNLAAMDEPSPKVVSDLGLGK